MFWQFICCLLFILFLSVSPLLSFSSCLSMLNSPFLSYPNTANANSLPKVLDHHSYYYCLNVLAVEHSTFNIIQHPTSYIDHWWPLIHHTLVSTSPMWVAPSTPAPDPMHRSLGLQMHTMLVSTSSSSTMTPHHSSSSILQCNGYSINDFKLIWIYKY